MSNINIEKYKTWDVYLNGKHIDTIFYTVEVDEHEVLYSLIFHDGYDPNISIAPVKIEQDSAELQTK